MYVIKLEKLQKKLIYLHLINNLFLTFFSFALTFWRKKKQYFDLEILRYEAGIELSHVTITKSLISYTARNLEKHVCRPNPIANMQYNVFYVWDDDLILQGKTLNWNGFLRIASFHKKSISSTTCHVFSIHPCFFLIKKTKDNFSFKETNKFSFKDRKMKTRLVCFLVRKFVKANKKYCPSTAFPYER